MELKTLKDLETRCPCDSVKENCYSDMLRQEAIKWIKMLREKRKEIDENNRYEVGWNEGRQLFLEEFFNISEEDLK